MANTTDMCPFMSAAPSKPLPTSLLICLYQKFKVLQKSNDCNCYRFSIGKRDCAES